MVFTIRLRYLGADPTSQLQEERRNGVVAGAKRKARHFSDIAVFSIYLGVVVF